MDEKQLQRLIEGIRGDPKVAKAIKRLDEGVGTYKEVNTIALQTGKRIADEMAIEFDAEVFRAYLEAGHGLIAMTSETAQANLNRAAGIGIKPKLTKTPNYKIDQAVTRVASAEPEEIAAVCRNVAPTLLTEMVDDIIEYNADFQKDAGLYPIIRRTWSGSYPSHDTRHTDWCHDLAGEWEYGDHPDNVFVKHEGCQCTVEYFPNKFAEGRITALSKYEVARNGELGAKEETLDYRIRRAEFRKEFEKKYR